ncbi:hypothetical protein RCO48_16985 [Peribacillus frigoritolerans]|nr:hypothetical protein [Peribacillus frigoritolerans]
MEWKVRKLLREKARLRETRRRKPRRLPDRPRKASTCSGNQCPKSKNQ